MNYDIRKKTARRLRRRFGRWASVAILRDLETGRGSWVLIRYHGCSAAAEIDADELRAWGRRARLTRAVRRHLSGDGDALTLAVGYDWGCGLYTSDDAGQRLAWVGERAADRADD